MDERSWLLGNINQTGYFRVTYDLHNWKLLIQQLHSNHQVGLLLASCHSPSLPVTLLYFLSLSFTSWLRLVLKGPFEGPNL